MLVSIIEHQGFVPEQKRLAKKHHSLPQAVSDVKTVIQKHFFSNDNEKRSIPIANSKIFRITVNLEEKYCLYKIKIAVDNLRPGQWPRMWFVIADTTITLLAIATHSQNYDNNEMDRIALSRYQDTI